jgi:peptidyl-prolyl cis-trans isomerase D
MLAKIRNATGLIISLFLLVGIGFIISLFFGNRSRMRNSMQQHVDAPVGKVDGEEIKLSVYDRQLESQRNAYSRQSGQAVPEALAERIREGVWDAFVESILMEKQLKALGLRVTDDMVYQELTENPPRELQAAFMNESGEFDESAYHQALTTAGPDFWLPREMYVRTSLLPQRMLEAMAESSVRVTASEIETAFREKNEKVRIRYVSVSPQDIDQTNVSDENLQAYYTAHAEEYRRPPQASLAYLAISKEPSESDTKKAHERILSIQEKLARGTDFGRLARIHSDDDGSAASDGDLGWFARGKMVPEFDEVVFALEPGALSVPFHTQFGWHIVQLIEKRTNDSGVEEVHARHILKKIKRSVATMEAQYEEARKVADAAKSAGGLQSVAGDRPVLTTPPFSEPPANSPLGRSSRIPTLGALDGAMEFAFSHEPSAVSGVMESDDAYYVLQVEKRIESVIPPLEDVRPRVQIQVEREKQKELALAKGRELGDKIRTGSSLAEAAEALGLEVKEPEEPILRTTYLDGIGSRTEVAGAAFHLPEGAVSEPIVMEERGVTAIVQVLEKLPVDSTLLADQRNEIAQQLLAEKRRAMLQSWLQEIRAHATIEDFRDRYYRSKSDTLQVAAS